MSDWELDIFRSFNANDPVSEAALTEFSKTCNFQLPTAYVDFARRMNGGEGFVGDCFIQLYRVEDLLETNLGYKFPEFFPGFFLFGSDGGGEAFAFRTSESDAIYRLAFIGRPQDAVMMAECFPEWLEQLANSNTQR